MREILFRGKRIDNGEWVYGFYVAGKNDEHWINYHNGDSYSALHVDPATVGQYVGLKDKDGKKIFEGDFIRNNCVSSLGRDIGKTWEVRFGEHMTSGDYYASSAYGWFSYNPTETHALHNLPTNTDGDISIFGSVHDSPELLK